MRPPWCSLRRRLVPHVEVTQPLHPRGDAAWSSAPANGLSTAAGSSASQSPTMNASPNPMSPSVPSRRKKSSVRTRITGAVGPPPPITRPSGSATRTASGTTRWKSARAIAVWTGGAAAPDRGPATDRRGASNGTNARRADPARGHDMTPSCTGAAGRGTTGRCFSHRRTPCKRISAMTRRPVAGWRSEPVRNEGAPGRAGRRPMPGRRPRSSRRQGDPDPQLVVTGGGGDGGSVKACRSGRRRRRTVTRRRPCRPARRPSASGRSEVAVPLAVGVVHLGHDAPSAPSCVVAPEHRERVERVPERARRRRASARVHPSTSIPCVGEVRVDVGADRSVGITEVVAGVGSGRAAAAGRGSTGRSSTSTSHITCRYSKPWRTRSVRPCTTRVR